ncbi:hypothetical protein [Sphingomonas sp.]|uniref:hypothetical protein n=1 Tax=Sphingomonas sp. TaxID=28214 RepID=UPI001ED09011|nr:hypothetical protein [Sphingomonas sp.]MBX3593938.1 hypothetical protein [Sphingomonas sp.]
MQRDLILARRRPGHPFRAALPEIRAAVRQREQDSDIKLFALSFAAFFVCFYTFIL